MEVDNAMDFSLARTREDTDIEALEGQLHRKVLVRISGKERPVLPIWTISTHRRKWSVLVVGTADVSVGDEGGQIEAGRSRGCTGEYLSLHYGDERGTWLC